MKNHTRSFSPLLILVIGIVGTLSLVLGACPSPTGSDTSTPPATTTVSVTGVSLNHSSATVSVGSTQQLTATVAPANATNKNVTWSSSDTAKATVSTSGLVTAVAIGTATITVTTEDGSKTSTCAVTVVAVGSLDLSFNSTGVVGIKDYVNFSGSSGEGRFTKIVPLSNSKILAVGYVTPVSGSEKGILARYNSDGSPDISFGTNGHVTYGSSGYNSFYDAVVDSAGNIYVAGREAQQFAVWKYSSSGVLDTSFSAGNADSISGVFIPTPEEILTASDKLPNGSAMGIGIDSSGKIVAGGYSNSISGYYWTIAVRLNTDGTLDGTYGTNGIAIENRPSLDITDISAEITSCVLDSLGRMVVTGCYNGYKGVPVNAWIPYASVWRFASNGSADTTFGTNGVAILPEKSSQYPYAITFDSDSNYYVAGSYRVKSVSYSDVFIVKLSTNGTPVSSFGTDGYAEFGEIGGTGDDDDVAYAIRFDNAGRLLVAGTTNSIYVDGDPEWANVDAMFVLRADSSSGAKDSTFGADGYIVKYGLLGGYELEEVEAGVTAIFKYGKDAAYTIAMDSAGKILVGGGSLPSNTTGIGLPSTDTTSLAPFVARFIK